MAVLRGGPHLCSEKQGLPTAGSQRLNLCRSHRSNSRDLLLKVVGICFGSQSFPLKCLVKGRESESVLLFFTSDFFHASFILEINVSDEKICPSSSTSHIRDAGRSSFLSAM